MPPRSQTTSSTGQASNEEHLLTSFHRQLEFLFDLGPRSSQRGDDLTSFPETTAQVEGEDGPAPAQSGQTPQGVQYVPRAAVVKPQAPAVTFSTRVPALRTRQTFEGTVISTTPNSFESILADKTNPANPDELMTFEFAEVSEEDRPLIIVGAPFFLTIGAEQSPAGQLRNVSVVQFRRVPNWTRSALIRAKKRGEDISEVFRTEV